MQQKSPVWSPNLHCNDELKTKTNRDFCVFQNKKKHYHLRCIVAVAAVAVVYFPLKFLWVTQRMWDIHIGWIGQTCFIFLNQRWYILEQWKQWRRKNSPNPTANIELFSREHWILFWMTHTDLDGNEIDEKHSWARTKMPRREFV